MLSSNDYDFWERFLLEKVFGISYEIYNNDLLTPSLLQEKTIDAMDFLDDIKSGSIRLPEEYHLNFLRYTPHACGDNFLNRSIFKQRTGKPSRLWGQLNYVKSVN